MLLKEMLMGIISIPCQLW